MGAGEAVDLFTKLQGMRILLVDDDEWIRDALTILFEGEACELVAVETAEQALQILSQKQCDIIITDYRLPGMNGLEFLAAIRESHSAVPKIFITAYGSPEVVSRANQLGICDCIAKPFTSRSIEETLSALVSAHRVDNPGSRGGV